MNRSLSSLAVILGSLFIAFFVTWFYLQGKAESKPLKAPFDHPFLKLAHSASARLILFRTSTLEEAALLAAAQETSDEAASTIGAWLDVRLGGENQLVVSPTELLTSGAAKGKPVEIATSAECKDAGLVELREFSAHLKNQPTIFNLISRRPGLSNKILEIWGIGKPFSLENVAIQSESDGTLKELREAQPRGFYGSSQATLIQMELLSNIGLAGLMDLKADMLVSSTVEMEQSGESVARVRDATLKEAHRRGLKRYAGPTKTKESAQELFTLGYDGVIIEGRQTLDQILESF